MRKKIRWALEILLTSAVAGLIIKYGPGLVTESPQKDIWVPFLGGFVFGIVALFGGMAAAIAENPTILPLPYIPVEELEKTYNIATWFILICFTGTVTAIFASLFISGIIALIIGATFGIALGERITNMHESPTIQSLGTLLAVVILSVIGTLIVQGVTLEQIIRFIPIFIPLNLTFLDIVSAVVVFLSGIITGIILAFVILLSLLRLSQTLS